MWDWIRGALGMGAPTKDDEVSSGSPSSEAPPEAGAPAERDAEASPVKRKKKKKAKRDPDAPKKPKKKKQRKQPPGWFKEDRVDTPDVTRPKRTVPEAPRPASLLPSDEPKPEPPPVVREAAPEAPPEPPPVPEAPAAEAAPSPEAPAPETSPPKPADPDRPSRPSPRQRDQATLAWIVVPKLEGLLADLDPVLADAEASRDTLVNARTRFLREWRSLMPLPSSDAERLEAARSEKVGELSRRIDAMVDPKVEEEKRNIAVRDAMIEAAEGLVALDDIKAAVSQAKMLQRQWRDGPRVGRDVAKKQTTRFRTAMDAVFARRDAADEERLVKLEALADSAEALTRSDDPEKAAEAMKRMQAQWKQTGGVRGEKGDAVWTRFRGAADAVFENRRANREAMYAQNLQARQALIEHANHLADEGVEDADAVIRDLQRKWRQTGHVARDSADALWNSFKEACDRIRNPPAMDPTDLGDGQGTLTFNPFAGIQTDDPGS